MCYPYTLGYVEDPAYFNGVRFFVTERMTTSRYEALPVIVPRDHKARLFFDFFKWLQTTDPGPIGEIRQRIISAQEWFDASEDEPESWAATVKAQKSKFDQAVAACGTKISGKLADAKKKQGSIYQKMSDEELYHNYFNVNYLSWVVAKCWDVISDVGPEWYPAGADKEKLTEAGTKVSPRNSACDTLYLVR